MAAEKSPFHRDRLTEAESPGKTPTAQTAADRGKVAVVVPLGKLYRWCVAGCSSAW